jgi:hypothetical protein
VTITGTATSVLNCYGSWTNAATGVAFSNSAGGAQVFFLATATGKTVTTNSVSFDNWALVFNSLSGGWTLGSAHSSNSGINVILGNFSTGNFNTTMVNFVSTGSGTRTVSFGSSTLTLNGTAPWTTSTTTNLTFNAGTSTIVCSNASPTFAGGGLTYNNVQFTSNGGGNTTVITGNNTFANLTQTSPTSNRRAMSIAANQTVTGTLTLGAANLYNARVQIQSSNVGNPVTLTVGTIATLSDVDFRDITAAGASGTWSGTRLGNGLGNTNITFAAGKTVYWNLVAGGNWSANAWATSSGGAVATANFPLAQDTVIINDTGLNTSNTITMDAPWWMGTLNVTRTNAWTLAFIGGPFIYGDVTLTSVTTLTGALNFNFLGQGLTQTLTTNGVSFSGGINQTSVGGTLVLNGAVTCASTATVTLNNGTLNLNNYTLTAGYFSSTNVSVRAITFGTGKIVVTGNNGAVFNTDTATNFSYTGSGNIEGSYSGSTGTRIFVIGNTAGGSQAVALNLKVTAGTDSVSVYQHWKDVDFTGFAGTLTNTGIKVFYGNLTLSTGMTLGSGTVSLTFAATSGTKTITSNGKTMDFPVTFDGVGGTWQLQDNMTLAAGRTTTLTNGTVDLNSKTLSTGVFVSANSNARTIAFGTGKFVITALNTPIWNTSVATNLTVTGTPTVEVTGSGTTGQSRIIDNGFTGGTESNAFSFYVKAGVDTITINGVRKVINLDFTGFAGYWGSDNWIITIYGNLVLNTNILGLTTTSTFTGPITFASTSATTRTITSAGNTYPVPVTFNGIGGTWACQDALTTTGALTLTNGVLQLAAGTTSTVGSFVTTGTTLKVLSSTVAGSQATISDSSGTNTATYTLISDSNATGGATWTATSPTNINGGNNTGWTFGTPVASATSGFFAFF